MKNPRHCLDQASIGRKTRNIAPQGRGSRNGRQRALRHDAIQEELINIHRQGCASCAQNNPAGMTSYSNGLVGQNVLKILNYVDSMGRAAQGYCDFISNVSKLCKFMKSSKRQLSILGRTRWSKRLREVVSVWEWLI